MSQNWQTFDSTDQFDWLDIEPTAPETNVLLLDQLASAKNFIQWNWNSFQSKALYLMKKFSL